MWTAGESLSNIVSGFSSFLSSSLCLFHWKTLYHSATKAFSSPRSYRRERKKKSGGPFNQQNNDTSSRSPACVHSTNLHNNLSKVKEGRADRKIAHEIERIKGRKLCRYGQRGEEVMAACTFTSTTPLSLWGRGEVAWKVGGLSANDLWANVHWKSHTWTHIHVLHVLRKKHANMKYTCEGMSECYLYTLFLTD